MASTGNHRIVENLDQNLTLHEMFRIVGDQLMPRDVRVLKFLNTMLLSEDLRSKIHDGYTFLLALEKIGRVDASNFKYIVYVLRIITRQDLIPFVTLRRRKTVEPDPVDSYLEETARADTVTPSSTKRKRHHESSPSPGPSGVQHSTCSSSQSSPPREFSAEQQVAPLDSCEVAPPDTKKLRRGGRWRVVRTSKSSRGTEPDTPEEIRKKVTCDIRLRVRAEYCHHENALAGNVFSNKPELLERQFEKFMQANTILKSRDLGSIICDIKFSELTYLDAFWRDYINGSLLEALKGVFITESLKQAVGHEAIKLLVNVDEDDYEAGRLKLLQNLSE